MSLIIGNTYFSLAGCPVKLLGIIEQRNDPLLSAKEIAQVEYIDPDNNYGYGVGALGQFPLYELQAPCPECEGMREAASGYCECCDYEAARYDDDWDDDDEEDWDDDDDGIAYGWCPECGEPVFNFSPECPSCGEVIESIRFCLLDALYRDVLPQKSSTRIAVTGTLIRDDFSSSIPF